MSEHESVEVENPESFECAISPTQVADARVTVGRFTYGAPEFKIWADEDRISIGSFCSIADDVVIFGGGEHNMQWVTTYPLRLAFGDPLGGQDGHPTSKGPTVIGNDVWLGAHSIILSGVHIGDGAVVGAGAVVTRDVKPYEVVAGNPARVIKRRFGEEQIRDLLDIQWWQWPLERIRSAIPMLCNGDIDAFIRFGKAFAGVSADE